MLTRALPVTVVSNLALYLVFLKIDANTLVDFGWAFNQFLIGTAFYLQNPSTRGLVSLGLLALWAGRLGHHMLFNRVLKGENDPRYEKMAQKRGLDRRGYFLFQFMAQAVIVLFPAIPIYYLINGPAALTWNFWLGGLVAVSSLGLEHLADSQLERYKVEKKANPDKNKGLFREGLWSKSRHPNLFFDWLTWVGFALMGFNQLGAWPVWLGPLSLYWVMNGLTIPITEKCMQQGRPNWQSDIKGTNAFWPL